MKVSEDAVRKLTQMTKYSDEDLLNAIRDVTSELGQVPTYTEYRSVDRGPSMSIIEKRLGCWTAAKKQAGVDSVGKYGKLPVNSGFFESIDTIEKAYWLGMLYGDGSIIDRGEKTDRVYLGLQDKEHVVAFKEALGGEQGINDKSDGISAFTVCDQRLANSLIELGCDSDKTFSDSLPNLERDDLRAAFVRGLFDADGYYRKRGKQFCITGAEPGRFTRLIEWLPSDGVVKEESGVSRLYVFQHHGVFDLWNWLYPDGEQTEPALERKKTQIPL
jgi:hypothetical protein